MRLMPTTLNLPQIQNDETLYSYVARCQWLWGETLYARTSADWFGLKGVCLNQCLPRHIQQISFHSGYRINYLLLNHTAFPLYSIYHAKAESLRELMCSSVIGNIANQSCSPQLSFGSFTKSKYCPECIREDEERVGVAYWHLSHQLWGVHACSTHGCRLISVPFDPRKYRLPLCISKCDVRKEVKADNWQRLFTAHVVQRLLYSDPLTDYRRELVTLFEDRHLFTHTKRIRTSVILEKCALACDLLGLPYLLNARIIRRIAFASKLNIHPLKALLLEFVVNEFIETRHSKDQPINSTSKNKENIESRAMQLLLSGRYSVAEISRRLKVSYGYIKQLAGRQGVQTKQNKKSITADIRRKVTKLAIDNMNTAKIAEEMGLSQPSVIEIIQSVSGLSLWRQYLRMLEKRDYVRSKLLLERRHSGSVNRKHLHKKLGNEIAWAYKYDKKWLDATFPIQGNHANHSAKIWEKRDTSLFPKFKEFLKQQLETTNKLPSKYALDKAFGNHRWFTCNFTKLSRCKRMYDMVKFKITQSNEGKSE